jgi:hypothetical protein
MLLLSSLLEISTRGHEYVRAIESRTWLPCLGDNFLVSNSVDDKFDLVRLESTYILHSCGKFGAPNQVSFF